MREWGCLIRVRPCRVHARPAPYNEGMTSIRSDVVVVGGGIVGIAHAMEAAAQGLSVSVLERDARAVGASVRNFGHLCFTAQADADLPLALSSREGWIAASEATGLPLVRSGTLIMARTEPEMAVLENMYQRRDAHMQLLSRAETYKRMGGMGATDVLGGAHLPLDLRANPRHAVQHLTSALEDRGVGFHPGTTVRSVESTSDGVSVETSRGAFTADRVIIAIGHHLGELFPDLAEDAELQQCRLSMARVERPELNTSDTPLPALLTGTSMTRYGAFTETSGAEGIVAHLEEHAPQLRRIVANVMATELPDGSLIIGDSHHYDAVASPFVDESVSTTLLEAMADVLGVPALRVSERWQGVYASSTKQAFYRASPLPGVDVVTVTSGVGMTMSFGLARETFSRP